MDTVIGLIGAKGAGKTTAYNAIKDVLDIQEVILASKLKDASAQAFGVPREYFDSHEFKEQDLEVPVYLDKLNLAHIFVLYGLSPDFDKYIRPHIGKVLHSPRQVAQYIGTEVLRNYDPDIHCNSAVLGIKKSIGVVTDMRFPNEYSYFKEKYTKFYTIYVQNTGAEIQASRDPHASEAYLKDLAKKCSETIQNNGSMYEFTTKVQSYVRSLI